MRCTVIRAAGLAQMRPSACRRCDNRIACHTARPPVVLANASFFRKFLRPRRADGAFLIGPVAVGTFLRRAAATEATLRMVTPDFVSVVASVSSRAAIASSSAGSLVLRIDNPLLPSQIAYCAAT